MELVRDHEWPKNKQDALQIQRELAQYIQILPNYDDIKTIVTVDTAYGKNADSIYAAAVAFSFPEIEELEKRFYYTEVTFPYIPGLYYFREGQVIIKSLEKIDLDPDLLIIHGHGIAHMRRCGIASMIGVVFDKPTVGCCRKILAGQYRELSPVKGSFQPIILKDKEVGVAYRTKDNVKPLFISPGHKCDTPFAKEIIVKNLRGFRMPEPLRFAHQSVNKYKRHVEKKLEHKNASIKKDDTKKEVG